MRIAIWVCAAVLAVIAPAHAVNYVELVVSHVDDQVYPGNPYFVFLGVNLDSAVAATSVEVNTPGGPATLEDNEGDGLQWELEESFLSPAVIVALLQGTSTITVTGTLSGTMTFTLDGSWLDEEDFLDPPTDLYPAHGQTVGPDELFTWTPPAGVTPQHLLFVYADSDSSGFDSGQLSPATTSYDPPDLLPPGVYESSVGYYLHSPDTAPLSNYQTTGDIVWGNSQFSPESWPTGYPLLALGSETIVEFTVIQYGDTDGDGDVDFDDFLAVNNFFGDPGPNSAGDADGDGDCDFDDFLAVNNFFGTQPPILATVPEPASLSLLLIGSIAPAILLRGRSRP